MIIGDKFYASEMMTICSIHHIIITRLYQITLIEDIIKAIVILETFMASFNSTHPIIRPARPAELQSMNMKSNIVQ